MNYPPEKFVKFQDWRSDKVSESDYSSRNGRFRTKINSFSDKFKRRLESGSESIIWVRKSWKSYSFNGGSSTSTDGSSSRKKILDPQGAFLQKWNKIFVLSCFIAVSLDPLFFYVPVIDDKNKCLDLDDKMQITASVLRSFTDIFYIIHIVFQFRTERLTVCWKKACDKISCDRAMLYCDGLGGNKTFFNASCPVTPENPDVFNFGIFLDALQSGVVQSHDFPKKLFYCFWWGLRNLSSLGQNLATSTFVWEICFSVAISIFGLVLFSFLIGNMQTYLQSTTTRLEEMRVKRRDAEQWMSHRMLPDNLKERIRRHEQYKWQETRGVDEEKLVHNLPKDIRRDIKRHLCLALLMRVPMFEKMDEQLLDAMCDRLKPALYTEESYIVREGDPVDEMLFVMRGKLLTMTTNGGRTGFFNSEYLKAGDFCGEELLTWALDPHTSSNLPISTRTVRTITEVEAFALTAEDLKFVASQFRRLHSKQIRHTFRFYSQQWRTWAACFIQAAWRRYTKKKLEEALRQEEDRLQDALAKTSGNSPSLGATIYASRFAANALRLLRRNSSRKMRVPERVPPMLLQKPAEPDFTADELKRIWVAVLFAMGQNVKPSINSLEIGFALCIFISGLLFFLQVIGIIQTRMLTSTIRMEEMKMKWEDVERWMSSHSIPMELQRRLKRHQEFRWRTDQGVDFKHLLDDVPKNLRMEVKRHLGLRLLKRVPMFENIDQHLLDAMCDRLKSALYIEGSYIVRENDPVEEMLFITKGKLKSTTTNHGIGMEGLDNSECLEYGFCGKELLAYLTTSPPQPTLVLSTTTVLAITEVEAFALSTTDFKHLASEFPHAFRVYSQHDDLQPDSIC
ncbi:Cyclic nucleotide-gated ion channel 1 [Linum grandiflorum]